MHSVPYSKNVKFRSSSESTEVTGQTFRTCLIGRYNLARRWCWLLRREMQMALEQPQLVISLFPLYLDSSIHCYHEKDTLQIYARPVTTFFAVPRWIRYSFHNPLGYLSYFADWEFLSVRQKRLGNAVVSDTCLSYRALIGGQLYALRRFFAIVEIAFLHVEGNYIWQELRHFGH